MKRSPNAKQNEQLLEETILNIALGNPLSERLRDHALTGNWIDHRECHLRPDLLLIYRLLDNDFLELVRLGSHSELALK